MYKGSVIMRLEIGMAGCPAGRGNVMLDPEAKGARLLVAGAGSTRTGSGAGTGLDDKLGAAATATTVEGERLGAEEEEIVTSCDMGDAAGDAARDVARADAGDVGAASSTISTSGAFSGSIRTARSTLEVFDSVRGIFSGLREIIPMGGHFFGMSGLSGPSSFIVGGFFVSCSSFTSGFLGPWVRYHPG